MHLHRPVFVSQYLSHGVTQNGQSDALVHFASFPSKGVLHLQTSSTQMVESLHKLNFPLQSSFSLHVSSSKANPTKNTSQCYNINSC